MVWSLFKTKKQEEEKTKKEDVAPPLKKEKSTNGTKKKTKSGKAKVTKQKSKKKTEEVKFSGEVTDLKKAFEVLEINYSYSNPKHNDFVQLRKLSLAIRELVDWYKPKGNKITNDEKTEIIDLFMLYIRDCDASDSIRKQDFKEWLTYTVDRLIQIKEFKLPKEYFNTPVKKIESMSPTEEKRESKTLTGKPVVDLKITTKVFDAEIVTSVGKAWSVIQEKYLKRSDEQRELKMSASSNFYLISQIGDENTTIANMKTAVVDMFNWFYPEGVCLTSEERAGVLELFWFFIKESKSPVTRKSNVSVLSALGLKVKDFQIWFYGMLLQLNEFRALSSLDESEIREMMKDPLSKDVSMKIKNSSAPPLKYTSIDFAWREVQRRYEKLLKSNKKSSPRHIQKLLTVAKDELIPVTAFRKVITELWEWFSLNGKPLEEGKKQDFLDLFELFVKQYEEMKNRGSKVSSIQLPDFQRWFYSTLLQISELQKGIMTEKALEDYDYVIKPQALSNPLTPKSDVGSVGEIISDVDDFFDAGPTTEFKPFKLDYSAKKNYSPPSINTKNMNKQSISRLKSVQSMISMSKSMMNIDLETSVDMVWREMMNRYFAHLVNVTEMNKKMDKSFYLISSGTTEKLPISDLKKATTEVWNWYSPGGIALSEEEKRGVLDMFWDFVEESDDPKSRQATPRSVFLISLADYQLWFFEVLLHLEEMRNFLNIGNPEKKAVKPLQHIDTKIYKLTKQVTGSSPRAAQMFSLSEQDIQEEESTLIIKKPKTQSPRNHSPHSSPSFSQQPSQKMVSEKTSFSPVKAILEENDSEDDDDDDEIDEKPNEKDSKTIEKDIKTIKEDSKTIENDKETVQKDVKLVTNEDMKVGTIPPFTPQKPGSEEKPSGFENKPGNRYSLEEKMEQSPVKDNKFSSFHFAWMEMQKLYFQDSEPKQRLSKQLSQQDFSLTPAASVDTVPIKNLEMALNHVWEWFTPMGKALGEEEKNLVLALFTEFVETLNSSVESKSMNDLNAKNKDFILMSDFQRWFFSVILRIDEIRKEKRNEIKYFDEMKSPTEEDIFNSLLSSQKSFCVGDSNEITYDTLFEEKEEIFTLGDSDTAIDIVWREVRRLYFPAKISNGTNKLNSATENQSSDGGDKNPLKNNNNNNKSFWDLVLTPEEEEVSLARLEVAIVEIWDWFNPGGIKVSDEEKQEIMKLFWDFVELNTSGAKGAFSQRNIGGIRVVAFQRFFLSLLAQIDEFRKSRTGTNMNKTISAIDEVLEEGSEEDSDDDDDDDDDFAQNSALNRLKSFRKIKKPEIQSAPIEEVLSPKSLVQKGEIVTTVDVAWNEIQNRYFPQTQSPKTLDLPTPDLKKSFFSQSFASLLSVEVDDQLTLEQLNNCVDNMWEWFYPNGLKTTEEEQKEIKTLFNEFLEENNPVHRNNDSMFSIQSEISGVRLSSFHIWFLGIVLKLSELRKIRGKM